MASSGKKNRKNKGTVISLQSFLSNGENTPHGTTQVTKKVRSSDCEESDDDSQILPQIYQLPTAPRASRQFDNDLISHTAPFVAYVTNLPFDIQEDDIYIFFSGFEIRCLRLPREDGDKGRVRGFGYIEFETRDELIQAISMPDPQIKGRRVRINLANETEQGMRGKTRRRYDGFGSSDEYRESTNWRSNNDSPNDEPGQNRSYKFNRDRQSTEDNQGNTSWRTGNSSQRSDSGFASRERQSDRNWSRDRSSVADEDVGERPKLNLQPRTLPLPKVSSDVSSAGDEDVRERPRMNLQSRNWSRDRSSIADEDVRERPKLNLQPRTLPLPKVSSSDVSSAGDEDNTERPKLNLQPRTLPLPKIDCKPDLSTDNESKITGKSMEKVSAVANPEDTTLELEIAERLNQNKIEENICETKSKQPFQE